MLYMPLTQTMGTTVHFNKFYSCGHNSFYNTTLSTGKQRHHIKLVNKIINHTAK